MVDCPSYRHEVTRDSPLYPLLKEIYAEGTTDPQLDQGFHQINYARPGEWGRFEGRGDCFVDRRELLRHSADHWRAHRMGLKAAFDKAAPWDLETGEWKTELEKARKERFRTHHAMAVSLIQRELIGQGSSPVSDDYVIRLARAMEAWWLFPFIADWKGYPESQKGEILAEFKYLDQLGLQRFRKFLEQGGGAGGFYDSPIVEQDQEAVQYGYRFSGSGLPHNLYFSLTEAGLRPFYVEFTGLRRDRFQCGKVTTARLGLGLRLPSGRLRLIDPLQQEEDLDQTVYYPITPRQAFLASATIDKLGEAMLSKGTVSVQPTSFSADGYVVNVNLFYERFMKGYQGRQKGLEGSWEKEMERFYQEIRKRPEFQHPLMVGYLMVLGATGRSLFGVPQDLPPFSHPALPPRGLVNYVKLISFIDSDKKDDDSQASREARTLLEVDPDCHTAHLFLSRRGAQGRLSISHEEIEHHFAEAARTIPASDDQLTRLHIRWGEFQWWNRKTGEARGNFEKALRHPPGETEWKAKAAWWLALLELSDGHPEKAAEFLKQSVQLLSNGMASLDKDDTLEWYQWFKDRRAQQPVHDPRIAKILADRLIVHEKFREAWEVLGWTRPERDILLATHKLLLLQGKVREAARVWKRLEGR